jgi:hypothetical protein
MPVWFSLPRLIVLPLLCVVAVAGCGQQTHLGIHDLRLHHRNPGPAAADEAHAAVDDGGQAETAWTVSRIHDDSIGILNSTAAGHGSTVRVRFSGLGWPIFGTEAGRRIVGPGLDQPYTLVDNAYSVSVGYSGRQLSLMVWSHGGSWTADVDGSKVTGAPQSVGSSYASHTLDLRFKTAQRRTITFNLSGGAWVEGLELGPGHPHTWLPARPAGPAVYWLGDSYSVGSGATYPGFDDLVHIASARARLGEVAIDALGGTGYVRANTIAKFPDFSTRAHLNLGQHALRPPWIVIAGSINDSSYSPAQVGLAAAGLYAYIRKVSPGSKVIVVPFASGYPESAGEEGVDQAVVAAADQAPNVVGVLDLPKEVESLTGRIALVRKGGGLVSKRIAFHPSQAGHRLYGRLIGTFLRHCIATVGSGGARQGVCDQ